MRRISALYPGIYCTVADMARTWPRCGHSEVVLKREDAATLGKEVELAGSICWRSTDVRNQLLRTDAVSPSCKAATSSQLMKEAGLVDSSLGPRKCLSTSSASSEVGMNIPSSIGMAGSALFFGVNGVALARRLLWQRSPALFWLTSYVHCSCCRLSHCHGCSRGHCSLSLAGAH
jgi:hypothetical protein